MISSTVILLRKPPNSIIWQKATVNWQKEKKGVMIISRKNMNNTIKDYMKLKSTRCKQDKT